jgi:hypothetical protein
MAVSKMPTDPKKDRAPAEEPGPDDNASHATVESDCATDERRDPVWVEAAIRWRDREDRSYYKNRSARWWSREYQRAGVR